MPIIDSEEEGKLLINKVEDLDDQATLLELIEDTIKRLCKNIKKEN